MVPEWFVLSNNQAVGPYTREALIALMQQGSLVPTTFVRRLDGPWITASQAFLQLVAAPPPLAPPRPMPPPIEVPTAVAAAPAASPVAGYAPSYSPRARRKGPSSAASFFTMGAAILIGGAASVYTVKNLGNLFPRPAPPPEPEVIVIPAPRSPKAQQVAADLKDAKVAAIDPAKLTRSATPDVRIAGAVTRPAVSMSPQEDDLPSDADAKAWVVRTRELFAKRDELIAEQTALQQEIQPTLDQVKQAQTQFNDLRGKATVISSEIAELKRRLPQLFALRGQSVTGNVDTIIASIQSQVTTLTGQYDGLVSQGNTLRAKGEELTKSLVPRKKAIEENILAADRLRDDLVWHFTPFAPAVPAVESAALQFFSDLDNQRAELDKGWSHFGRACMLARKNDEAGAEKGFKSAIALLPNEATFPAVRGAWRARLGKPDEGLQDLIAATKLNSGNRTVPFMYALVQCRRGIYSGAETKLRECMKLDPSYARAKRFLSLIKSATDDAKVRHSEFAMLLAKESLEIDETPHAHFVMASALAEQAKLEEALKHAQQAVTGATPAQSAWYRESLRLIEAKKPLRIDWKTFDSWANL